MNLFDIAQYELYPTRIMTTIAKEDSEKEIKVNRQKFEAWLERTGRLAIPMQFHDDTPGEESAELAFSAMTFPEYFELGPVKTDLYEFMLLHQGQNDFFGDALKSLTSICNEYKN